MIQWPADPYKGLTYYGRNDVPLFAGRTTDVRRVARILASGSTRILLLHGNTGCGKSSFLRAGLIPFLEEQAGRFAFTKDSAASADAALFVRCSHDPLLEVASRTYDLALAVMAEAAPETGETREPIIDSRKYATRVAFTAAVADDPERLVAVIGEIAYRQPRTMAMVVDQAEELLTLKPGQDGDAPRRRFFTFLAYLSESSINFRLIIAFRTEYHGRFYATLRSGGINATAVEDYYLADLTRADLLEAIRRPTSTDDVAGYGVPRDKYLFYYEEGLPDEIARDLEKTPLASGALPVLQIVCRRLYQKAKASPPVRGQSVIRQRDYQGLGGIEGQIDLHLQQALTSCCEPFNYGAIGTKLENMRWRDVLSTLAKPQADGSITTDVKPASVLAEAARFHGCKMPMDKVMEFLEKDEWRIVRCVELTRLGTNEKINCYSLGHDVLGGVLQRWREGREKDRAGLRKELATWGMIVVVTTILALSFFTTPAFAGTAVGRAVIFWVTIVGVGLGCCIALLATIPNSPRFHLLYRPVYGFFADLRAVVTRL